MLETFEQCPMKWAHQSYFKDVPYEQNKYAKEGDKIHKALEFRLRDKIRLPRAFAGFERYAKTVEGTVGGGTLLTEAQLGVTRDLSPCGFFDADVWGRAKLDVVVVKGSKALILDWKTGKFKSSDEQLRLSSLFVFMTMPEVETVKIKYVWLKDGRTSPPSGDDIISRDESLDDFDRLYKGRIERAEGLVGLEDFDYRPSPLCGWCSANKHGLCPNAKRVYEGG